MAQSKQNDPGGPRGQLPEGERRKLTAVNLALRALHKTLIDVARSDYERHRGSIAGPGMLLGLLMEDPFFSWLRPMSRVMVEIDELLEEEAPMGPFQTAGLRERIEGMISTERYLALLQSNPEVVMSHTALRKAVGDLS